MTGHVGVVQTPPERFDPPAEKVENLRSSFVLPHFSQRSFSSPLPRMRNSETWLHFRHSYSWMGTALISRSGSFECGRMIHRKAREVKCPSRRTTGARRRRGTGARGVRWG